jgi:hypothetical protein
MPGATRCNSLEGLQSRLGTFRNNGSAELVLSCPVSHEVADTSFPMRRTSQRESMLSLNFHCQRASEESADVLVPVSP